LLSSLQQYSLAKAAGCKHSCHMVPCFKRVVVCRYSANIGVVLLNKFLLSFYGFAHPALLTLLHMCACSVLCTGVVLSGTIPRQPLRTTAQLSKVALLSAIFTATIILGNISLQHIPVACHMPAQAVLCGLHCTKFWEFGLRYSACHALRVNLIASVMAPVAMGITLMPCSS
jgi:hypothetical protein